MQTKKWRRLLSLLGCTLMMFDDAIASSTVTFKPETGFSPSVPTVRCSFEAADLPPNTVVLSVAGFGGKRVGFQIDENSGTEATQFDIAVHSDRPVALLLGAHDPTIWNIGWTPGTRIAAVYATGYERQVVAGLPSGTPVIVSSFRLGHCGANYFTEEGVWNEPPDPNKIFGFPVTGQFFPAAADTAVDVTLSARPEGPLQTSSVLRPESFRDANVPFVGERGIAFAVARGFIRPASAADIEALVQFHTRGCFIPDDPKVARKPSPVPEGLTRRRTFVVLKPFTFPAGLYENNDFTFIVPKGVELPWSNAGMSWVYDFNHI